MATPTTSPPVRFRPGDRRRRADATAARAAVLADEQAALCRALEILAAGRLPEPREPVR